MHVKKLITAFALGTILLEASAFADNGEAATVPMAPVPKAPIAHIVPYRTFITVTSYIVDNNGDAQNPISNVRLEIRFPGDKPGAEKLFELPEAGQYWTVGNKQKQEINRTYELPWKAIANDGLVFQIQMVRKGSKMLPCNFTANQLSQFNRNYFCHTDVQWQMDQRIPEEKIDREGIQVRVFTDKNTPTQELPKDSLALR